MLPLQVYAALWLAGAVMLATSKPSHAAGIAGIGNAAVTKGQFQLHLRESFGTDNGRNNLDNRWRQRIMTDYAFTNSFASGIYLQGDKRDNRETELDAVIWDNRFEIHNVQDDGFFSGFRLRYTYRDGDKKPDNIHIRGIIGAPIGNWEVRFNPIVYSDVGPDSRSGIGLDLRGQVTYSYLPGHRAGIETFWDTGKLRDVARYDSQSHNIGAVFAGNFTPEWGYETGYAYGLSNSAPDHTLKLFITRYF
jgi:hypothetical protein